MLHLQAFPEVAKEFGTSITSVANAIGIGILGLGTGSLLWNPIAESLGRRWSYLIAFTLFIPCTFWLAFATSYTSFAAARYFAGFCGAVTQTVPASIIADTFTQEWRGTAVAMWSLLIIIGPVSAPVVGAALLQHTGWRWIYYLVIIFVGVSWVLVVLFVPETRYVPPASLASADVDTKTSGSAEKVALGESGEPHGRRGVAWLPWKHPMRFVREFFEPIKMAVYLPVLVPSLIYAMVFCWSVGFTVVSPQVLEEPPWSFTRLQVGYAFLAALVGGVIGKFAGGFIADLTVHRLTARAGVREPEFRLWACVPHFAVVLPLGLLLYGLGFANELAWPAEVIGGMGIYYFANSALGGIIQTYICETHIQKSVHGIALFNLIKCSLAFAAPFFIPQWAIPNFQQAYIVQAVLTFALGLAFTLGFIVIGKRIRIWQHMPISSS